MTQLELIRDAILSEDGIYRYKLTRRWVAGGGPPLPFVMLNPSTADADIDDPTIRRCMGFARKFGYDALTVVNLYAMRTTRPVHLWERGTAYAAGPENRVYLSDMLDDALDYGTDVVCAWGAHAKPEAVQGFLGLASEIDVEHRLKALRVTQAGAPGHPLYLPGSSELIEWPA